MFFYGFILVQFGAIDFIWKGLIPGAHLPFGPLYPGVYILPGNCHIYDFSRCRLGILSTLY